MISLRLGAVLLIVGCCGGCDFLGTDEALNDVVAPADSITIVSVKDLRARITVYSRSSDPCWLYTRSTESHTEKEITMKFYKIRKEQNACPQVVSWLTIPVEVAVATAGKYTLRFYRSESSTLDTVLTF